VVSLVAELRAHERQADRGVGADVPSPQPAARHGERKALAMEKSRGADDQVDPMSQASNLLRAYGEPTHVFPANASTPDRVTGPPGT
jgi:hypothetical protein